jgi:D-glycero-alpha-D-manno-heptose-7-phosphate kinase
MKSVIVRSPTRVDLAGGTLDLWPLYNFIDGAVTVNVAIDIFTTAEITERADGKIELISDDLKFQKIFSSLDECLADKDPMLNLLKLQLKYWRPTRGFTLRTRSESPVGGGLGGSSSLTVSLLKAFDQFCQEQNGGLRLQDTHALVQVAHNIEAEVLNTPTGTQDYYPAASGGINILRYSVDGISQTVLAQEASELAKNFLLIYTGKAHHSGLNNFEVLQRAVAKEPTTVKALNEIKAIAEETAVVVKNHAWEKLPDLFRAEFAARVKLAKAFSSPEIDQLAQVSLQAGAQAVKICGAGGGGCVLVWAPPNAREKVASACQQAGFQVLAAKPVGPLR